MLASPLLPAQPSTMSSPVDVLCMATSDEACDFKPRRFQRRALAPHDVLLEMKYCGVCHTDLHVAAGHTASLMGKHYPCVPGHELAGVATAVGSAVTRVKVGDHIGVGCMVDSCLKCAACLRGEEQKCLSQVATYGGVDKFGRAASAPGAPPHTLGGYTSAFVVHERFAIIIPRDYPLEAAGPVMCAGVTLFDPLRRYGATNGTRVGIVGLGGLGQMGVKLGKALGCTVTVITRSVGKSAFAKECGADSVLVSSSASDMAARAGSFDLILNTIPSEHDYTVYTRLLDPRRGSKHVILGLNTTLVAGMVTDALVCGSSRIKGSGIGSIEATQAVIDLCASRGIKPTIKIVPVEGINDVMTTLAKNNDSGERFVIDLATLNDDSFSRCKEVRPPSFGVPTAPISGIGILSAILSMLCCCRWR